MIRERKVNHINKPELGQPLLPKRSMVFFCSTFLPPFATWSGFAKPQDSGGSFGRNLLIGLLSSHPVLSS
jgi:hypothetical protein